MTGQPILTVRHTLTSRRTLTTQPILASRRTLTRQRTLAGQPILAVQPILASRRTLARLRAVTRQPILARRRTLTSRRDVTREPNLTVRRTLTSRRTLTRQPTLAVQPILASRRSLAWLRAVTGQPILTVWCTLARLRAVPGQPILTGRRTLVRLWAQAGLVGRRPAAGVTLTRRQAGPTVPVRRPVTVDFGAAPEWVLARLRAQTPVVASADAATFRMLRPGPAIRQSIAATFRTLRPAPAIRQPIAATLRTLQPAPAIRQPIAATIRTLQPAPAIRQHIVVPPAVAASGSSAVVRPVGYRRPGRRCVGAPHRLRDRGSVRVGKPTATAGVTGAAARGRFARRPRPRSDVTFQVHPRRTRPRRRVRRTSIGTAVAVTGLRRSPPLGSGSRAVFLSAVSRLSWPGPGTGARPRPGVRPDHCVRVGRR
ncbi:MAG: hypothetical protein WBH47_09540 [Streptosporangiaceae bacterium]